jgi:group I intron endonuclease
MYYNLKILQSNKMIISKALIKYGYSNFSFEILEYCAASKCIEREQYYIDLLNPEYNISPKAGSRLGSKHSEETIAKLKGRKISEETIAKFTERMKGNTYGAAHKGIKRSAETIAKLKGRPRPEKAGSPSIQLEVLDLHTEEKTIFVSMSAFANFLGVPAARIASYFSSKTIKPYKGRYVMRKISN